MVIPRIPLLRAFSSRILPSKPILPITRLRPLASFSFRHVFPAAPSRAFRYFTAHHSEHPPTSPSEPPQSSNAPLSQRFKHLVKSYGWYALGVYVTLSILDFGVAFASIQIFGADYLAQATSTMRNIVVGTFKSRPSEPGMDEIEMPTQNVVQGGHDGFYAMLFLAYTVHKTLFLPIRIGLTAALTPRLVAWLSRRGWAGKDEAKRVAASMRERM